MGVEPTSGPWKGPIIAVIPHPPLPAIVAGFFEL